MKSIVANNTKSIIEQRCLKQCAVAKKAGYSNQQFNDMLNGRRVVRDTDVQRIAAVLEVDANTLFYLPDQEEENDKTG